MKKKLLVILLAMTMVFTVGIALTGCGGSGEPTIANARQITIGMNRNEVRGLVGTENNSISLLGTRVMNWNTPSMRLEVVQISNSVIDAELVTNTGTYWLSMGTGWSRVSSGDSSLQPETGGGGGNQGAVNVNSVVAAFNAASGWSVMDTTTMGTRAIIVTGTSQADAFSMWVYDSTMMADMGMSTAQSAASSWGHGATAGRQGLVVWWGTPSALEIFNGAR